MPDALAAEQGSGLIAASVVGTAVFAIAAVVAALAGGWTLWPAFVVAVGLFLAGCVGFVAAYATAVARSRTDEMGIGGLFFLAGSATAPARVKRWLLGAFAVQVVVALGTAIARPFSTLAFGALVPLFGVGVQGMWAARHGRFGTRVSSPPRRGKNDGHG